MTEDELKAATERITKNSERIEAHVMGDRPWAALVVVRQMWDILAIVGEHMAACHGETALEIELWFLTLVELITDVATTEPERVYAAVDRAIALKKQMVDMAMVTTDDLTAVRNEQHRAITDGLGAIAGLVGRILGGGGGPVDGGGTPTMH